MNWNTLSSRDVSTHDCYIFTSLVLANKNHPMSLCMGTVTICVSINS